MGWVHVCNLTVEELDHDKHGQDCQVFWRASDEQFQICYRNLEISLQVEDVMAFAVMELCKQYGVNAVED